MEIINANSAYLSNYEVMKHLQKIKDSKKKHRGQLATITYETLHYLEETPCKSQTPDSVSKCLKALEAFNLSKTEKLMLINFPPTTPVEIQLVIGESEDNEDRLSDEQVEQVLEILAQHFPDTVPQKNENDIKENSD